MKKIFKLMTALTLAASVVSFYSCSKPDDEGDKDKDKEENVDPNPKPDDGKDEPDPQPGGDDNTLSFKSIDFDQDDLATWVVWDNKIALDNGFTYVLWVMPYTLNGQQRIGNIADVADEGQSCINMLRFGERAQTYNELQWMCGGNSRVQVYAANWTTYKWTQLALVCDGTNLKMYLDGELAGEDAFSTPIKTEFGAIEFANSWGKSYRGNFHGSICQISVYDTALSADELSGAKLNGLTEALKGKAKAWWPMQEGEGHVCKDEIGSRNIDFSNTIRNDNDGSTQHYAFDASSLISWIDNTEEI